MSILSFSNLSYSYDKKKNVFSNISAEMELGKIYAILGQSGCGKTTLLSLLGGLDSATKGKILFNGEDIMEKGLANHRRNHVSFVFQAYNLIDYMTPLENVKLTSKLPPEPILEKMGLTKEEMKRNNDFCNLDDFYWWGNGEMLHWNNSMKLYTDPNK